MLRASAQSTTIRRMQPQEPSNTAKIAALARGYHRLLQRPPWVIDDPYALSLIGPGWEELWETLNAIFPDPVRDEGISGVAARARYVEDVLARGTFAQYVILGAGLDSFAWRRPDALAKLRLFEVDHPATQAWKRERAEVMALPRSDHHVFTPVDFEHQTLDAGLAAVGFDASAPTLYSWIAVIPYLTIEAVETTLRGLAGAAAGSQVVLSYAVTEDFRDDVGRRFVELLGAVAAQSGEPFLTFLSPSDAEELVARCGLEVVEHLDRDALRERFLAGRDDIASPYTVERVLSAAVPRR
jgi:methyltransferase (TIGR00027 family)